MPRSGGTYSLPSPPNPLVANTLAKAGDMNTTFTDIATALTNSLPLDGSAAMTGNLNANSHNITNIGTVVANNAAFTQIVAANVQSTVGSYLAPLQQDLNANNHEISNISTVVASIASFAALTVANPSTFSSDLYVHGVLYLHSGTSPYSAMGAMRTPREELQAMLDSGTIDLSRGVTLLMELALDRVPA